MNIVEVKNLAKTYPKNMVAVKGVSFNVEKGEIFALLGPNGAGKSTTIGMLATLITPTSGTAVLNGFSVMNDRDNVRRSLGLVFQDPSLDDRLTGEENLRFHARLYGVPSNEYAKRMEEVLRMVDMWERRKDIVKTYSGGMKRRLEIARGLIHYPAVLFLDEPTLGLDPQTRNVLWEYILRLQKEKQMTIFLTTHYMGEAEFANRIAIIDHGEIVALDTPANLKLRIGEDTISLKSAEKEKLRSEIKERFKLEAHDEDDGLSIRVPDGKKFMPRLFNELTTAITSVELRQPTLDDVFLHMTGRAIRDSGASSSDRLRRHHH